MVNDLEDAPRWQAPGSLEAVRRLLNTWDFSPRTGEATDHLPDLAAHAGAWRERFPDVRQPARAEVSALVAFRDGLRRMIEVELDAEWLNGRLRRARVETEVIVDRAGAARIRWTAHGTVGQFLSFTVAAIELGLWDRLKSCPDCRLVFFDRSRNRSKRWCQMSALEGGRSCGSIAKVTQWRARQRGAG